MNANPRPPLEHRGLDTAPRVEQRGDRPVLTGYACKFDVLSELLGQPPEQFREVFRASAVRRLAERRDVKFLASHDAGRVLGSTRAGTLRLQADAIGLRFHLDPPDSPAGLDLVESVRRGDVSGMSIGFKVLPNGETWRGSRPPLREVLDADIFELSACAWPAYAETTLQIEQRALDHARRIVAGDRQQSRWQDLRAAELRLAALR
jgi:HK97 family phage prohead protease